MLYKDAFKTATKSLTHGKLRSILTMLGIVIGIASVIILMSIGSSAQKLILNQVESIGSNLVIVIPGASANGRFSSPASAQGIIITSLQQQQKVFFPVFHFLCLIFLEFFCSLRLRRGLLSIREFP